MENKDREQLKKLEKNFRDTLRLEKQALLNLKSLLCIFYNLMDIAENMGFNHSIDHERVKDLFDKATKRLKEIEEDKKI